MANREVPSDCNRRETFQACRTADSARVPIPCVGAVEAQSVAHVDAHKRGCPESQKLSSVQLRQENMDVRPKHTWDRDVSTVHRLLGSNTYNSRNQVNIHETKSGRSGLGDSLAPDE